MSASPRVQATFNCLNACNHLLFRAFPFKRFEQHSLVVGDFSAARGFNAVDYKDSSNLSAEDSGA